MRNETEEDFFVGQPPRKLRHMVNPCDIDRLSILKPVGDFFALFSYGTDCTCCLGARIFFALVVGIAAGVYFG